VLIAKFNEYRKHFSLAEAARKAVLYCIEEGREEGRNESYKIIARSLLAEGSTHEFVQKITGLSLDEIANL